MKLEDIAASPTGWLKGRGPRDSIVLSTRVRVARNISGRVYVEKAGGGQRLEILSYAMDGIKKSGVFPSGFFARLKDLDALDKNFLAERHLMSREHVDDPEYKGLVVGDKGSCSVMVNEEDHIRLQVLMPGFDVIRAWKKADEIENIMAKHLEFDYSNSFGYLTSCPTNTGTGLRASCMLHLTALVMTGQIDTVFDGISKLGMTIRGFYGEGTEAVGDFFQISNQVALGRSEMDILDNLVRIISKVIDREDDTRKNMLSARKEEISDRVERSLVTLKTARIITSSETIKLLSTVRLGIDIGIVKDVTPELVNEMLLLSQPAHLQRSGEREIAPHERDIKRADLIRHKFGGE